MVTEITERSLYPIIIDLFRQLAKEYNIRILGVQEVKLPGRKYPDIFMKMDGHKLLIQVKIDSLGKLLEDIAKSYPPARSIDADLLGILFPTEVRRISPTELEKVGPNLKVLRGLALTFWQGQDLENITLIELVKSLLEGYSEFQRTNVPLIDYLTIAKASREAIEELSTILRRFMGIKQYSDMSLAIVGRFDYYRAMLEDFLSEEESRVYIADIMAYLTIIQLLFLHVVSKKVYGVEVIPKVDNPLAPPSDLVQQLLSNLSNSTIIKDYHRILGALPWILETLKTLAEKDYGINLVLAKYIYALHPLRPEHVKDELFGRIYQLGLPPETRKNLGAFFTKPQAAKILARLAIKRWDDKVLDPACGSGTLLAEAYQAKLEKGKRQGVTHDLRQLHTKFLCEDIIGIDIMQFAKELSSINLALQNPSVKVNPRIYAGDGIGKMVYARTPGKSVSRRNLTQVDIWNFLEISRNEYEGLILPHEGIDVVIMNPPFTKRERIPKRERKRLDTLLGSIVRGKTGYWSYFFAATDYVIKPNGHFAAVTPEEFFAGRSSESLRRFMLLGEEYSRNEGRFIKRSNRIYAPKIIIRSGVETAFSEGASYRDYLVIFKKQHDIMYDTTVFVILKRKLEELSEAECVKIAEAILNFKDSSQSEYSNENLVAMKVHNVSKLLTKHIDNLKPLVGLNCLDTHKLLLELLEELSSNPTLKELEERGLIALRDYNPGQYITRGVEEYARRLFIRRYRGRGKVSFVYVDGDDANLILELKQRREIRFPVTKKACLPSLRSPAGVRHMDITGEEEYVIVNPEAIPREVLNSSGLINLQDLDEAAEDIRQAYSDLAGNILLVRRVRLTSPNIYWLTFFSENNIIGPSAPMICVQTRDLGKNYSKLLTLYLNSTITLLQLLGFAVETEGAWIALQGEQVWSHVHVPDIEQMSDLTMRK